MKDFRMQMSATDYGNFLANEPLPLVSFIPVVVIMWLFYIYSI